MQTEQRHSHHHPCRPCHDQGGSYSSGAGPEMFYGYCHHSRRMRMMNYTDYVGNMQTGLSNLYGNPALAMQPMMDTLRTFFGGQQSGASRSGMAGRDFSYRDQDWGPKHHDCGCHEHDCGCECCIRCADLVEYVRCGETRQIPITFENDTRRERNVKLELGSFSTEGGQSLGWQPSLSESEFKLGPCGEKTVLLTVTVECGSLVSRSDQQQNPGVDSCKLAYATLRADDCMVRPLVIAVAILPSRCGAHTAPCGCGCC